MEVDLVSNCLGISSLLSQTAGEPVAILVVCAGLVVRLGCDGVSLIPPETRQGRNCFRAVEKTWFSEIYRKIKATVEMHPWASRLNDLPRRLQTVR